MSNPAGNEPVGSALLDGLGGDGGDAANEAGLAPRGLVGVNDALGRSLVDALDGLAQPFGRVLRPRLGS